MIGVLPLVSTHIIIEQDEGHLNEKLTKHPQC